MLSLTCWLPLHGSCYWLMIGVFDTLETFLVKRASLDLSNLILSLNNLTINRLPHIQLAWFIYWYHGTLLISRLMIHVCFILNEYTRLIVCQIIILMSYINCHWVVALIVIWFSISFAIKVSLGSILKSNPCAWNIFRGIEIQSIIVIGNSHYIDKVVTH